MTNKPIMVHDADAEYHAQKRLSKSGMDKLLQCPALFRAWQCGAAEEDTPALRLGTLFHSLVLEPETADRYHVCEFPGTTKAGKAERAEAEAAGKRIITVSEWDTANGMADAVRHHPMLKRIFGGKERKTEMSVYWTEDVQGIPCECKARVDMLVTVPGIGPVAIDLKSSQCAAPDVLGRKIMDYGYHRQAAWYQYALSQVGIDIASFLFVFVEKTEPYIVTPASINDSATAVGLGDCRRALETYAECQRTNTWPCYTQEIVDIDLPDWAYRKIA